MSQLFLSMIPWKKAKILLFSVGLLLLGYVSGCGVGDDGIGERLSGPASDEALPIRIDATVTPTFTPTPESERSLEEDLSIDAAQLSPTPLSEEELISPTPTSSLALLSEETSETEASESELTPAPSPLPKPTPTPLSTATATVKAQVVPMDTPVSSPDGSQKSSQNLKEEQAEAEPEQKVLKTESTDESESEPETESDDLKAIQSDEDSEGTSSQAVMNSSAIKLDQIVICSKITNRDPANAADKFSLAEVGKVYTWMQVSGVKPPQTVKHIYYWEGRVVARVTLKLRYASMRTWSEKTFKPEESLGKWKVVITTNNEKEILATKEFTVTP